MKARVPATANHAGQSGIESGVWEHRIALPPSRKWSVERETQGEIMKGTGNSSRCIKVLSRALFEHEGGEAPQFDRRRRAETISALVSDDFSELWNLATSHHVILRTFRACSVPRIGRQQPSPMDGTSRR